MSVRSWTLCLRELRHGLGMLLRSGLHLEGLFHVQVLVRRLYSAGGGGRGGERVCVFVCEFSKAEWGEWREV